MAARLAHKQIRCEPRWFLRQNNKRIDSPSIVFGIDLFQVEVNNHLRDSGLSKYCRIPVPVVPFAILRGTSIPKRRTAKSLPRSWITTYFLMCIFLYKRPRKGPKGAGAWRLVLHFLFRFPWDKPWEWVYHWILPVYEGRIHDVLYAIHKSKCNT